MPGKANGHLIPRSRRLIFQPESQAALARGIAQLVNAIRPTLGPMPRLTGIENVLRNRSPEIMDDGGTIARRIVGIADREAEIGAMLLREALWKLREEVGDGTATAAIIFQTICDEGRHYLAAGANAMDLRAGLERGLQVVHAALADQASPLEGQETIARVARSICHDGPMAEMLGEIFDIIGEYGSLEIRTGNRRGLEREYVEGAYWPSGWLSPHMVTDQARNEARLQNAAILISNFDVKDEDVPTLATLLERAARSAEPSLLIVAQSLSERALALLLLNRERTNLSILAVKAPSGSPEQMWSLQDMAALSGGQAFFRQAGQRLNDVRWDDLGRARRVWATREHFGLAAGQADPNALRQHITSLRASLARVEDSRQARRMQERVGRLMGGAALLWVGGQTDSEALFRRDLAERTANALRKSIRDGVVPGGGIALVAGSRLLSEVPVPDRERAALRILSHALEAPARVILENAGYEPSQILAQVAATGPECGFDVTTGRVVDMRAAGILDGVSIQQAALRTAVMTAALALTTDVLVCRALPETGPRA